MTKDRNAAHVYPGIGWRWQEFGGRMMLVTDGRGADVVLSGQGFVTCSADGLLVPLKPDTAPGILFTAIPDLATVALDIHARNDRMHYLPRLNAALLKAGLLP